MASLVIRVEMLASRYHAHVWGEAQHAMGGPEWPPSPWRLLRTIAACWFGRLEPPSTPAERDDLLRSLGRGSPPRMWLPTASFDEVPYYQPLTKDMTKTVNGRKASVREVNSRVLHYDHFAILSAPALYFVFDAGVSDAQRDLLAHVLAAGRYFGRAESRASFALEGPDFSRPERYHEASPAEALTHDGAVRRPVLVTTGEFEAQDLWRVRPQPAKRTNRESTKEAGDHHPEHLVEALIAARKPQPDGTRWAHYELPRAAVVHALPVRSEPSPAPPAQPTAEIVFRLFRRVPIPVIDTVRVARDLRDQAVRAHERATGGPSVLLSGREADGSVARGHRHAYYLPQTERPVGFLSRLVVVLPAGEAGVAQDVLDALLGVTRLLRNDTYPVLIVPEEVRPEGSTCAAKRWCSWTPYLAPLQHRRGRAETDPQEQLLRALVPTVGTEGPAPEIRQDGVVPVLSHLYDPSASPGERRFRMARRAARCFTIEFAEPVRLPVALGADAHFGLGQFGPEA